MSWLIHRTGITRGAAVGHSAWAKRVATHPRVLAALAAGSVSESVGRVICLSTDKLPHEHRDAADERKLLAAAAGGLELADLAGLFAEMYVRARGDLPDQDPGREFADREVKLATTIGGAGVVHGDLTAECAAAVAAVLDALSAPAGKEDDRTKGQRYHDALQEAMRRLTAANLLPERAGQPVKAWAHISLADLLLLDGDSALQEQLDRAGPGAVGRPPRVRRRDRRERRGLAGRRRRRGHRLRRRDGPHRHRRRQRGRPGGHGPALRRTGPAPPWRQPGHAGRCGDHGSPGRRRAGGDAGKAVDLLSGPGGLASFLRRLQLGARLAGPSLPLDIGYAETVPAGIRNAVLLRDRHCRWAGSCTQPAGACEVHHTKHKAHGGKTSVKDCVLLCPFHHQIVIHRWGWTLVVNPDGTTTAWNKDKTKVLHSHGPPARAG